MFGNFPLLLPIVPRSMNRSGPWTIALFFSVLSKYPFDFPLSPSNLFFMKTSQGFQDGHIWYSVFSRSPRSSFTRAQRASCCFSLLLCTMLTSIMFWGVPKDPAEQKMDLGNNPHHCLGREIERQQNLEGGQLNKWAFSQERDLRVPGVIFTPPLCLILTGKIEFTWQEVMIGFESSLLMFPINLLIVQIFRNTRSRPATQGRQKKPGKNGRVSPSLPPASQVTQAVSLTPEAVIKASPCPAPQWVLHCPLLPGADEHPRFNSINPPCQTPSSLPEANGQLRTGARHSFSTGMEPPTSLRSACVHLSPCTIVMCNQNHGLEQTLNETMKKTKGITDPVLA